MSTISSFIKCPINTKYEGEDSDEQILYLLRRSHLTNIGWCVLVVLMLLAPLLTNYYLSDFLPVKYSLIISTSWYLAVIGVTLFNFLNWFFNVYIISNKKIVDFDFYGLSYKNISETPLSNIQDTTSNISGPIKMIFNVGSVFIQTAGEKNEFDFENVDNPGEIRDILSDMVSNIKEGKDVQL